jgi:hypothetical protein
MERYVLRVWLPNRPGALGAVASRIGAVKGDVIGIEILETGEGVAVDELVVELPDATVVDLLLEEVRQVDGVEVEELRSIGSGVHDPLGDGLEVMTRLVAAPDRSALLEVVTGAVAASLQASWMAVLDLATGEALVGGEGTPTSAWLAAFVHGVDTAASLRGGGGGGEPGEGDVASASAPEAGLAMVAGRDRIAWRARERRQLTSLTQVVALRWTELAEA